MNIGQIGLGQITAVHRDGYRRFHLPVTAGYDINPEARKKFSEVELAARVHDSLDSLLEDPNVDVLDLAAPHHVSVRKPLLAQVLKAGKPILLQKPFAHHYADALEYTQMAEAVGVPLMLNQNALFGAGVVDLAGRMTDGTFGQLYFGSVRHTSCHAPSGNSLRWKDKRWWLIDVGIHELAIVHHFFGPPETVYATAGRDPHQQGVDEGSDGFVHAILRYKNGASIVVNQSGAYLGPEDRAFAVECHGDFGTVSISPGKHAIWSARSGERMEDAVGLRWFPEAFGLSMAHFQWCLEKGRTPFANAADNLFVMAVVEACYHSVDTGLPVRVADIMGGRWIADYGPGFLRGAPEWVPPTPQEVSHFEGNYAWATYLPET
jgi:predicted dehydrogenase